MSSGQDVGGAIAARIAAAIAGALPAPTGQPYGSPDTFGSVPGNVRVIDPATGVVYTLGLGPVDPLTQLPTVVYIVISSWALAKSRLPLPNGTWAAAKAAAPTWGVAKAFVTT
jgi:hypothetical protein